MQMSLEMIQELAPDQASLNAAKKLLSPAKWPVRGKSTQVHSIWGQCQGSGANPYFTMADVSDHGYKCTCPSRKFPCKHVLALLWQFAETPSEFSETEIPEWVNDWLGRRRKTTVSKDNSATTEPNKPANDKNIHAASDEPAEQLPAETLAKKQAAQAKRAAKASQASNESISAGMLELEQWIDDQLRTGISDFIKHMNPRCRRIAARLVDAKATVLASRLDELPAKLMALPLQSQASTVFKEFGQLVLLCEAWFTDNEDADVRRAVTSAESRESVLQNSDAIRQTGLWEKIGEKIVTRRDGLVSHASWLINVNEATSCFALLLDHYPASAGKRESGMTIGSRIEGELVFYPSRAPLRAFPLNYSIQEGNGMTLWPSHPSNLWTGYQAQLSLLPWSEYYPYILNKGRLVRDHGQQYWWQDDTRVQSLPISNNHLSPLLLGSDLDSAFVLWDGEQAELFCVQTNQWGTIAC